MLVLVEILIDQMKSTTKYEQRNTTETGCMVSTVQQF